MRLFLKFVAVLILTGSPITGWSKDATEPSTPAKKTVGILLYPGVQIIDFTGPWEVFGQARYQVKTVAQQKETISTAMKMQVVPDYSFKNAPIFDIFLVPGGHHHNAFNQATNQFIQQHAATSETVLSVCTGSFLLAEAGLLDQQKSTTFFKAINHFKNEYPQTKVVSDQRWVDNGKIITSAGLSSGIDTALHVVAKNEGIDIARTIAMHIEYDWNPDSGFVRGKMADRMMPRFQLPIPDYLNFERTHAYGDRNHWFESYQVTSEKKGDAKETIVSLLHKQLAANKSWSLQSKQKFSWITKQQEGHWEFQAQLLPTESPQQWTMVVQLTKKYDKGTDVRLRHQN